MRSIAAVTALVDASRRRESARWGWIVVAAAFTVMFIALGSTYTFPAFFAPLQQEFGAPRASLSWAFSIGVAIYFAVGALSGPLTDRFGARWVVLTGMILVGAGLIVAARATSLWALYLGIGLGLGIGVGFAYVPSISAVQRWFVLRRGFASGIAVSGIGVGTLVMPKIAEALIDQLGWRGAYLTLGLLAVVGGGLAALFVDNSPERRGLLPDGGVASGAPPARGELPGMSVGEALRSKPFRLLYIASVLASIGLFMPFVHLTPSAEDRGVEHSTAVTLFALIGVGSTAGRFLIGGIADRLGRRRSLMMMFAGIAVMLGWWMIANTAFGLGVFALMFGACYGGYVALAPALLADYFGPRNASGIIGLAYTAGALGTLLGPPLAGYAFDVSGSYVLPIAGAALAALLSAALVSLLDEPGAAPRP
ncbi:MFS transporter [Chelatococcus reniformis]|uniref:MFS transporter n=1 Tax=Chelatococcus reniformis TaxID=1494448 RepID=A0A916UAT2_9HYPH|nr:MFS transporter [Chelatococcus reniformis]GGC66879.1 MFS transporter [Chelatococcus reniformis]